MPRINFRKERKTGYLEQNLGRMIIFCEGQTEKYYFDEFVKVINKEKYDDIAIEVYPAKGNAKHVLNFAKEFLREEDNNRLFSYYQKHLMFDCDAPDDIQEVIKEASCSKEDFILLVTNSMFEVWLLMHFENVETALKKSALLDRLEEHLQGNYSKASEGIMREILHKGNINDAIENAESLQSIYNENHLSIFSNIEDMNPYTNVHQLVERLATKMTNQKN